MKENRIKEIIRETLQLENPVITNIRRTPGGMTNTSYFVTVNGEALVVRLPGKGTEELVNRQAEKDNLLFGTKLGVNPPLLYFNTDRGMKITHKIAGATPVTPTLARKGQMMQQIIHLFKHLHTSETSMKHDFKLFDLIAHYESLVRDATDIAMENLSALTADIMRLQRIYESLHIQQVPCHIDPVCANLIIGGNDSNELYLIDWEYGGMFDPLWDISTLIDSLVLQTDEKQFFLQQYLERQPTEEELQRLLMHRIFQNYLWGLWALFKEAQGDDVGNDVMRRFKCASENVALYKDMYDQDIVV